MSGQHHARPHQSAEDIGVERARGDGAAVVAVGYAIDRAAVGDGEAIGRDRGDAAGQQIKGFRGTADRHSAAIVAEHDQPQRRAHDAALLDGPRLDGERTEHRQRQCRIDRADAADRQRAGADIGERAGRRIDLGSGEVEIPPGLQARGGPHVRGRRQEADVALAGETDCLVGRRERDRPLQVDLVGVDREGRAGRRHDDARSDIGSYRIVGVGHRKRAQQHIGRRQVHHAAHGHRCRAGRRRLQHARDDIP